MMTSSQRVVGLGPDSQAKELEAITWQAAELSYQDGMRRKQMVSMAARYFGNVDPCRTPVNGGLACRKGQRDRQQANTARAGMHVILSLAHRSST